MGAQTPYPQPMHGRIAENQTVNLVTADATLEVYDQINHASIPAAGSITLTLPPVSSSKGIDILVHVISDGGGTSVIVQDGDDAYAPYDFKTALFNDGDTILLHCDGERWDYAGHGVHDPITVKIPLAAVDTAGGLFSWQNPESVDVVIEDVYIDVTTEATGACTADIGYTATSATTLSATLIDGLNVGAAAIFGSEETATVGVGVPTKAASGKWVTGSVASGASAGIVGFAYITYRRL